MRKWFINLHLNHLNGDELLLCMYKYFIDLDILQNF